MKRRIKQALAFSLVLVMIVSMTGCMRKDPGGKVEPSDIPLKNNTDTDTDIVNQDGIKTASNSIEFIKGLKATYASTSSEQNVEFGTPMYNVKDTDVFRFEASEEAGYKAYKAFAVYKNPEDIDNNTAMSFCRCSYENGEIVVSAAGTIDIDGESVRNIDDGTWGSYNKLYLAQYINLQTGEDLVKPFVTPFSISHELDAPVIKQGVTSDNIYKLSWEPVSGAKEYRVYHHYGTNNFELEAVTQGTEITSAEFNRQKKSNNYTDLINQDLGLAGTSSEVRVLMNEGVRPYDDSYGRYVVIAANENQRSGISNVVNINEIANRLPYRIDTTDSTVVVNAQTITDIPTYVDVEMIDGSKTSMIINYHGSKATQFEDKIWIQPTVINTSFSPFILEIYGLDYDDMMANISVITSRQDSLTVSTPDNQDNFVISEAPAIDRSEENAETKQLINEVIGEVSEQDTSEIETSYKENTAPPIPSNEGNGEPEGNEEPEGDANVGSEENTDSHEEAESPEPAPPPVITDTPTTNDSSVITPDGYSTTDLMVEVAMEMQSRLSQLDDSLETVLFARNDLQSWLVYGLVTNMEVIPVPVSVFPDAANLDLVVSLFVEGYRQNPTSGMVLDIGYSYDYESLIVEYKEDWNTRLERANKEIQSAKDIANQLSQKANSEYEKVIEINNYICDMASYDTNSAETEVDLRSVQQDFVDAHTPYGVLCKNYGVCESYAESMTLIGRFMGLDVRCVIGTLYGGGHEWNKVKMGGNWYIVDITNNDSDIIENAFLNATDEHCYGTLVEEAGINLESLNASDPSQEFYTKSGLSANNKSDAERILTDNIKSSGTGRVGIRVSSMNQDDLIEIGQNIYNSLGENIYVGLINGVFIVSKTEF